MQPGQLIPAQILIRSWHTESEKLIRRPAHLSFDKLAQTSFFPPNNGHILKTT
jgi:hypothetical protein